MPGKLTLHQKILNTAASLKSRGVDPAPRKKVAQLCGFPKGESGSYKNALRTLRDKKKFVEYTTTEISVTDAGMKNADPGAEIGSNKDALEDFKAKFKSSKMKEILGILFDGKVHNLQEVREKIGATNLTDASFKNVLGPLKTQNLIEKTKDGNGQPALQATDDLFPYGRPN